MEDLAGLHGGALAITFEIELTGDALHRDRVGGASSISEKAEMLMVATVTLRPRN